jgi:hypothetical protein
MSLSVYKSTWPWKQRRHFSLTVFKTAPLGLLLCQKWKFSQNVKTVSKLLAIPSAVQQSNHCGHFWTHSYSNGHQKLKYFTWRSQNQVRFEFITGTGVKMAVLWSVVPCRLAETGRRFRGTYYGHHQDDVGVSEHIWNVGKYLRDHTLNIPGNRRLHYKFKIFKK